MFFFIGGVQPKTVTLDSQPHGCPHCGRVSVRRKRVDHYFALFFIPIFRVKTGVPFFICEHCDRETRERQPKEMENLSRADTRCRSCNRELAPTFLYCPYCGRRMV